MIVSTSALLFTLLHSIAYWLDEGTLGSIAYVITNNVDLECSVGSDIQCVVLMEVDLRLRVSCVRLENLVGIME